MTDELKQWFLDGHNKLRNKHALGQTGGLFSDTVSNMASMVSELIEVDCVLSATYIRKYCFLLQM